MLLKCSEEGMHLLLLFLETLCILNHSLFMSTLVRCSLFLALYFWCLDNRVKEECQVFPTLTIVWRDTMRTRVQDLAVGLALVPRGMVLSP